MPKVSNIFMSVLRNLGGRSKQVGSYYPESWPESYKVFRLDKPEVLVSDFKFIVALLVGWNMLTERDLYQNNNNILTPMGPRRDRHEIDFSCTRQWS